MKTILILGAGRSSASLIKYLQDESAKNEWQIVVSDRDIALAEEKCKKQNNSQAIAVDIFDQKQREKIIQRADIVISMLPAQHHIIVANTCLKYKKNMLTASYVSEEIKILDKEAKANNIIILNECGLDPGIDHMTAMQAIDQIHEKKGEIISFKSFAGGLIAPESDDNPWHYKFTWNPRNVVLAGQGTTRFIRNGQYKYIPYNQLFRRTESVFVQGYGAFEAYPNRDSLKYREIYGLHNIPTILRGTLRKPGFCETWNLLVQLGMTDDSYQVEDIEKITYRDFTNSFLAYDKYHSVEEKLCQYLNISPQDDSFKKLKWLGLFEKTPINQKQGTPASILQHLLEKKWALAPKDKDMIVMQHQFEYQFNNSAFRLVSSMITKGDDLQYTAMAKTVGWPLGIATKMILNEKVKMRGVVIPTHKEIYVPVLEELRALGVSFIEEEVPISQYNTV